MKKKSCFVVVGKNFIAPLYPGLQISGMTNGAECDFPAPRHPVRFLYGIWARQGGFTLIELLVVVLIIGILAAVALPQYKVAVEKARMAEAMTILKSVKEAQERYYLANGDYATKFEDLDIDIAGTMNVAGTIITLPSGVRIGVAFNNTGATNKNNTISLISFYTHTLSDLRQCYAKQNDVVANQVCKNLGGKIPYDSSGGCALGACTIYTL